MFGIRRAAVAVAVGAFALGGTALALAGPAAAEPPSGQYIATVIDGGGHVENGATARYNLTPCGEGCVNIVMPFPSDLHLEGNAYNGVYAADQSFGPCTLSLDANTLILVDHCDSFDLNVVSQLVKA